MINRLPFVCIALLVLALSFSVFRNISYPLMWQDEAETAMYGKRVLEYGYPKVHDGRNTVYQLVHPDTSLGIDEKTDAYVGSGWAMYYVSALGVLAARQSDDLYGQTMCMRLPFGVLGLAGILLVGFLIYKWFTGSATSRMYTMAAFLCLELLSIALILHLREVRYYSLAVFLLACTLSLYFGRIFAAGIRHRLYGLMMVILLLLLFVTFYPMYVTVLLSIIAWEVVSLLRETAADKSNGMRWIDRLRVIIRTLGNPSGTLFPVLISLFLVIPLAIYFQVFRISSAFDSHFRFNGLRYIDHIVVVVEYFYHYEFLLFAFGMKLIAVMLLRASRKREPDALLERQVRISQFLTILFVAGVLIVSRIPYTMYERFFISLQPVLVLMILADTGIVIHLARSRTRGQNTRLAVLSVILAALTLGSGWENKLTAVGGHIHELVWRYAGPLDYTIPYIRSQYPNTRDLLIATNYEEFDYMFYLDCRTIIGHHQINMADSSRGLPDIISYRKAWRDNPAPYQHFLETGTYDLVTFPVFDSPVNNIPELVSTPRHLYETRLPAARDESAALYVRVRTEFGHRD